MFFPIVNCDGFHFPNMRPHHLLWVLCPVFCLFVMATFLPDVHVDSSDDDGSCATSEGGQAPSRRKSQIISSAAPWRRWTSSSTYAFACSHLFVTTAAMSCVIIFSEKNRQAMSNIPMRVRANPWAVKGHRTSRNVPNTCNPLHSHARARLGASHSSHVDVLRDPHGSRISYFKHTNKCEPKRTDHSKDINETHSILPM